MGWASHVLYSNTVSLCFIASIRLIPTRGWIQQLLIPVCLIMLNHPLWSMYVITCRRWKDDNICKLLVKPLVFHVSISFAWLPHCNNKFCRSKADRFQSPYKVEPLAALVRSQGTCPKLTWRKKTWGRCNRMKGKDVERGRNVGLTPKQYIDGWITMSTYEMLRGHISGPKLVNST